ncbi:DUF4340 domain-containing protein [Oculatella sp. LEGE 06141]|uniref:DUF4340 domain-containing protein n=1 Tax=Oculatella sp. LEGE 06141 TaxID=1828648 RepID=UPI00187F9700|nr:DUF4340 domain-containing protein [Oculatella sp. LEGE 06141]MBE9177418.1 DUF4340 domain-containing protein [Oculatella sp. LEGE 06141]
MKLKPVTMILLVTALVLGGVVYVTQNEGTSQQTATANADQTPIFNFTEADVQALTVETQTRSLQFERNSEGQWQMLEPDAAPAADASVAYLLNLLVTGRSAQPITVAASDQAEFGLNEPLATISVTLQNNETHRLVLGGYDFNRSFMYAQVDPPTEASEELEVRLVSTDFNSAVRRPTDEWKQAEVPESPAPATPTASPSPSPTAGDASTPATSPGSEANSPSSSPEATPEPESAGE